MFLTTLITLLGIVCFYPLEGRTVTIQELQDTQEFPPPPLVDCGRPICSDNEIPLGLRFQARGFEFNYPGGWRVEENQFENGKFNLFYPPEKKVNDNITLGFILITFPLPDDIESHSQGDLLRSVAKKIIEQQVLARFSENFRADLSAEWWQHSSNRPGLYHYWSGHAAGLGPEGGKLLFVLDPASKQLLIFFFSSLSKYSAEATPIFSSVVASLSFTQEWVATTKKPLPKILQRVIERLRTRGKMRIPFEATVEDSNRINAWAHYGHGEIHIPQAMLKFLGENEGELAFLVSHEVAHLIDRTCGSQPEMTMSQIRECESRADQIGFAYMVRAGYNPYDAAAFFGRLQMFKGKPSAFGRIIGAFGRTHPFDDTRIENLRKLLQRHCLEGTIACF